MYSRRDYVIMHTFSSRFCVCLVEILIKFVWDLGNFAVPLDFYGRSCYNPQAKVASDTVLYKHLEGIREYYRVLFSIKPLIYYQLETTY